MMMYPIHPQLILSEIFLFHKALFGYLGTPDFVFLFLICRKSSSNYKTTYATFNSNNFLITNKLPPNGWRNSNLFGGGRTKCCVCMDHKIGFEVGPHEDELGWIYRLHDPEADGRC